MNYNENIDQHANNDDQNMRKSSRCAIRVEENMIENAKLEIEEWSNKLELQGTEIDQKFED